MTTTEFDFRSWRERLGLNRSEAALILGLGRNQPQRYEEGQPVPLHIEYACLYLEAYAIPASKPTSAR